MTSPNFDDTLSQTLVNGDSVFSAKQRYVEDMTDVLTWMNLMLPILQNLRDQLTNEAAWKEKGLDSVAVHTITEHGVVLALGTRSLGNLINRGFQLLGEGESQLGKGV